MVTRLRCERDTVTVKLQTACSFFGSFIANVDLLILVNSRQLRRLFRGTHCGGDLLGEGCSVEEWRAKEKRNTRSTYRSSRLEICGSLVRIDIACMDLETT